MDWTKAGWLVFLGFLLAAIWGGIITLLVRYGWPLLVVLWQWFSKIIKS